MGFLAWDSGGNGTCIGEGELAFLPRSERLFTLSVPLPAMAIDIAWMAARLDRK